MSTLVVTNLNDGGAGSLRDTIAGSAAGDLITFDPGLAGGTLTLTNGELAVSSDVIIEGDVDGNGTPDITIDAAGNSRVLSIGAVTAKIDGLIITGGNSSYGGGIDNGGNLTVAHSTITGNHVGGGIHNVGTLTLDHVTVSGNTSDGDGGGIANTLTGAALIVFDSAIVNNTAAFNGGGIKNIGGDSVALTNVTLYGNSAGGAYGGGAIYSGGSLTLTQVTITGNHAAGNGGGLYIGVNSATIANSIVAGNNAGSGSDDVFAVTAPAYAGVNVVGTGSDTDATDHVINTPTLAALFAHVVSVDPDGPGPGLAFNAGQLADNGGGVQTVAINPTGIAHDAGGDAAAVYDDDGNPATPDVPIPTDARDLDRVVGAHVDIGAFEQQAGQSFVVTTLNDELDSADPLATLADFGGVGDLSLREALVLAQQDPTSPDTITFDPSLAGGTLTLTNGELAISSNVTIEGDIDGNGTPDIAIDAAGNSRVLSVGAVTAAIDGLVITGGSSGYGGGIDNGGNLTVGHSTITDNHIGGGIHNVGTLTLDHVTVSYNTSDGDGGGIANALTGAALIVFDSAIVNNTAAFNGGAIKNIGGDSVALTNVTLHGNSAGGAYGGGAIYSGGSLSLTQVTITGNHADNNGGGIYVGSGSTTIANSIIAGNAAGGGSGDVFVGAGSITYDGLNVVGTGADTDATDHVINTPTLADLFAHVVPVDPDGAGPAPAFDAGQLADNGGTVQTVAIRTGGLAHDTGDDSAVPAGLATDARDLAREVGAHVDIGAVELQAGQGFVVTTLTDELDSNDPHATLADFGGAGDLSLREALVLAQQDPLSADAISFAASLIGGSNPGVDDGHLTLTNGSLIVAGNVTIDGDVNGDDTPDITLDGGGSSNVMAVVSGTSTLNGLAITNGSSLYGGGLIVGSYYGHGAPAEVTVSNSIVRDNSALYGGGIAVGYGTLHLVNTIVAANHADIGGGIAVNDGGTLTALNTTISGNDAASAYGYGGGLANAGSSTLINSTVAGNHAIAGGGIYTSGDLTLVNTTVANNIASYGGGLYTTPCGCATATLTNSTVTGNYATSGGGIYHSAGTLNLTNTIVAGNGGHYGSDLVALDTVSYSGVNIFSQSGVGQPGIDIFEPFPGNIFITLVTIDPDGTPNSGDEFEAGALANNGGRVQTVAINPTGVARDAGSDTAAVYDNDGNPATPDVPIPTDARGLGRTSGAHVDIGAFEVQPAAPTDIDLSNASVAETSVNGTVVGSLSDTDSDPGDSATYTLTDDAGGRFAISGSDLVVADGSLLDYETSTSHQVTVTVTDGAGLTFDKVFSIDVTDVNEAPVAANGAASGDEDTTIAGTLAATDVDSGSLAFSGVADAAHGSVTVNADGTFTYTPDADFNGTDSFSFKANDGALDSNVATVTLTIAAVNDAPVATNGAASGNEDTVIAGTLAASDIDSASLSYSRVANAAHGSVTVHADGSFSYTPDANFNGTDSFSYKANDGALDSNAATVSLMINAVNDAPVAVNGSASGSEDAVITGTASATDIDSSAAQLTFVLVGTNGGATHGSVVLNANGAFIYTPAHDFNGPDSFNFKVSDGTLDSNLATESLSVSAVNDAPVNTVPGPLSVESGADTVINGLAVNDVDAVSLTTSLHVDHGTLAVGSAGGAAITGNGTATVMLVGSVAQIDATLGAANNVIYHGASGFDGTDHLTMTSNDGGSSGAGGPLSDTDTVDINVGSSAAPPHLAYSDFHLG